MPEIVQEQSRQLESGRMTTHATSSTTAIRAHAVPAEVCRRLEKAAKDYQVSQTRKLKEDVIESIRGSWQSNR